LFARSAEIGALEERNRLAREIHDTLAQGLTGIVTQLEAARSGRDATRRIEAAIALARQSLSEARRSVHALRPEPLVGARLPDAVAQVARDWSELHGVPAQVTTTGDAQPMHPDVEVVLLRAAQEALANVGRHAGASRVGLTLSYMGDVVTLDVRDDGVGFTPNGVNGGYGLAAMRERLAGLSGTLAIESEPSGGTAISATVPALPA
jgi:signal transduction histidine kinase